MEAAWEEIDLKRNYYTSDIIDAILEVARNPLTAAQCRAAENLGLERDTESMRRLWSWVRQKVEYIEDGTPAWKDRMISLGVPIHKSPPQDIPFPARSLDQGFSDCKGMAILVSGHLQYSGIPHTVRFSSHHKVDGRDVDVHHVFVVSHISPFEDVIIDCTIPTFNREALPIYKRVDYPMLRIISGPDGILNDGQLELDLYRERLELETGILQQMKVSGATEDYAKMLADLDAAASLLAQGHYDAVAGVGKIKVPPIIKNAANAIKNGTKAVLNVLTAPQELLAREAIAVALPAASPFFVYLFLNKPELLPEKARQQRKKAEKIAAFVTETLGMKEERFMQILRNGIMKKMGKTPEQVLAEIVTKKISGVGVIPALAVVASEAVPVIMKLINAIAEKFGKKKPVDDLTSADAPSLSDVESPEPGKVQQILQEFTGGNDNTKAEADSGNSSADGSGSSNNNKDTGSDSKMPGWLIPVGLGLLLVGFLAFGGKKKRGISGARRRVRRRKVSGTSQSNVAGTRRRKPKKRRKAQKRRVSGVSAPTKRRKSTSGSKRSKSKSKTSKRKK